MFFSTARAACTAAVADGPNENQGFLFHGRRHSRDTIPPTRPFTDVWDNISPPAIGGRSGGKSVVFRFASMGRPCPLVSFSKFCSSVIHLLIFFGFRRLNF
jgi:hypothetical protein